MSSTEPLPDLCRASELISSRQLRPTALLARCLSAIDQHESAVNAWAYLDTERAWQQAESLDSFAEPLGPLHGLPVGIKDIIDVAGMPTEFGHPGRGRVAEQDAECVRLLRQAGAVILGKTVTTAYASFDPPPTRNPHDLSRTPGGSSSGSAAAVAAQMCLAALGTQTGGSILRPASYCGVCGFKPAYGSISKAGVFPLAPSLDHIGFLTRSVRDLALLSQVFGLLPPRTESQPVRVVRLMGDWDERCDEVMRATMDDLLRWPTVVGANDSLDFAEIIADHRAIMAFEAGRIHSDSSGIPPRIGELVREGHTISADEHSQRLSRMHELRAIVQPDPGEVWLTPAATGPAPDACTTGDPICNSPFSYLGLPALCVPIGRSAEGLPLAVQLIGATTRLAELFRAAQDLELFASAGNLT